MNKFLRSWELFKSSLAVMVRHKTLVAFPIIVAMITVFLVVLFLMPVAFQPTGYSYTSGQHWEAVANSVVNIQASDVRHQITNPTRPSFVTRNGANGFVLRPIAIGYFAMMYLTLMFLATFLNVAFYHEILNALTGQPVSLWSGLGFAAKKWKIILLWALFAGLVGLCIKAIERRFGFIGQWIARYLGAVWSVACVFVIPVIVTEQETANPLVVLKKSARTLVTTWGESLIGYAGVSLGSWVILMFSFVWLGSGITLAVLWHSVWVGVAAGVTWLGVVCVSSYLLGVASQIFRCALFLYASQGTMPHPYSEDMMSLAWRMKKSR